MKNKLKNTFKIIALVGSLLTFLNVHALLDCEEHALEAVVEYNNSRSDSGYSPLHYSFDVGPYALYFFIDKRANFIKTSSQNSQNSQKLYEVLFLAETSCQFAELKTQDFEIPMANPDVMIRESSILNPEKASH